MSLVTTYTSARASLAALCDEVASTREPVIIRRRNAEDVALISADELESLLEMGPPSQITQECPAPPGRSVTGTAAGIASRFCRESPQRSRSWRRERVRKRLHLRLVMGGWQCFKRSSSRTCSIGSKRTARSPSVPSIWFAPSSGIHSPEAANPNP